MIFDRKLARFGRFSRRIHALRRRFPSPQPGRSRPNKLPTVHVHLADEARLYFARISQAEEDYDAHAQEIPRNSRSFTQPSRVLTKR